jgi:hypothetical protein
MTNKNQSYALHKRSLKYLSDSGFPWEKNETDAKNSALYHSSTQMLEKRKENHLEHFSEFIYGRSLRWYRSLILWPIVFLLIGELCLRIFQSRLWWSSGYINLVISVFRVFVFIFLALYAAKQFKATKNQTIFASALSGVIVGFTLAILQLFWYPELRNYVNLLVEPLLFMVIALASGWLISDLLNK